jgi:hypothetical protein
VSGATLGFIGLFVAVGLGLAGVLLQQPAGGADALGGGGLSALP